jgi:hypothetical protein
MPNDEPSNELEADTPIIVDEGPADAAVRRLNSFVKAEMDELIYEDANSFLDTAIAELILLQREIETGVALEDEPIDGEVCLVEKLDENGTDVHEVVPVEMIEPDMIPFDTSGLLHG